MRCNDRTPGFVFPLMLDAIGIGRRTMSARIFLLVALLTSAFAGPVASQGKGTVAWDQVGGWHIRVDRSIDDSCFAHQTYGDGTWLRIGFDMKYQVVYFAIGNSAWDQLEAGKVFPVHVVFDDRKSHDVALSAFVMGSKVALGNGDVGSDFTRDFMEGSSLRIVHRGLSKVHLRLRDSAAAIERVAACQQAMQVAADASTAGARTTERVFSF